MRMPTILVLLILVGVLAAVVWLRRTGRPTWFTSRGPWGLAALAGIALCLLVVGLNMTGVFSRAPVFPAGSFVVRFAPFASDDPKTGSVVAQQLLELIKPRLTTAMNVGLITVPVVSPTVALETARRSGAQVLVWGAVIEGTTADAAALRPIITWQPGTDWRPGQWVGSDQFAWAAHYAVARQPVNGTVVLPPLLDTLAVLGQGDLDAAQTRLKALRRDYDEQLQPVLPATLEMFIAWAQGLNDEAIIAAQEAVAAAPAGETYNNLAVVLAEAGRSDEALRAWNEALLLMPGLNQARQGRARLLIDRDRAAARADAELAVQQDAPGALALLATIQERQGQLDAARVSINRALEALPDDPLATLEQAFLALTTAQTATGRLEWLLEEPVQRTGEQLGQLRLAIERVLRDAAAARAAALQQAAAAGVAGQAAAQRHGEAEARRLEPRQHRARYILLLISIEEGRLYAANPPNPFTRFWGQLRGTSTPLETAATLATTLAAQPLGPQLAYDVRYQEGRARFYDADTAGARGAWNTALALTNTATLPPQPEAVYGQAQLLLANDDELSRQLLAQTVEIAPNYLPARRAWLTWAQRQKRWAEAEAQLRWFVAQTPQRSLTLELAEVVRQQDRHAETEALLLPLANKDDPQALVALGELYRTVNQLDAAETVIARALALTPSDAAAHEALGRVLLARPDPDLQAAEQHFRQALATDPQRGTAHLALAQLLLRNGNPAAAAQSFEAASAINSNDPEVHRNLGEALLSSGQPGPAAESFRQAIRLAPNNHEAHHGLATAYFALGRLREARAEEETTLQLANGNYTLALVGLGDIDRAENNLAAATEHYNAALAQDTGLPAAYVGLAQVALAQGQPNEAISQYRAGLAAHPTNVPLLLGLGDALLNQARPAEALVQFAEAQRIEPGNAAAFAGAGRALWQQGDPRAQVQFEQAVRLNPGDADALLLLGDIYAAQRRSDAALQSYALAAEARPKWYAPHYLRGVLLVEANQPDAALEELETAVRLNPDLPQGHYWLGRAFRATQDNANAERQLRQAVEIKPDYYEARLFLGRILAERGKPDEARTVLQALVDEAPVNDQWRAEAETDLGRLGG